MKSLLLVLGLLFVGCAKQNEVRTFPVPPPPFQKPDLSYCNPENPEFDLVIKFDKSNLNVGTVTHFVVQVGNYPYQPNDEFPVKANQNGVYKAVRGNTYYVTAVAKGMNGSGYAPETSLKVLTCEELEEKAENEEPWEDVTEVTVKFY